MISLDFQHETLLSVLTQNVRLLSCEQVTRLLGIGENESLQIVHELEQAELIAVETHLVAVSAQAAEPLCSWVPGENTPDFRAIAYRLRKRWENPREMRVVLPASRACKQFGGTMVRPRSAGELDHDLWVSDVYLWHRERLPVETAWISGDKLRSDREADQFCGNVPDACLRDSSGEIKKIIEAGGKGYGREKLVRLHESYSFYPYEIW